MNRRFLGLPRNWLTIVAWMSACLPAAVAVEERIGLLKKKCPEIPKLSSYASAPEPGFWINFPFFSPPAKPQGKIDTAVLEDLISSCWPTWGVRERKIAQRTLKDLKEGAGTQLERDLTGLKCANAKSAIVHGEMMTDNIAHWVRQKFVAGPFKQPPFKSFRVNALMAVAQKTKIRPVLNLSAPGGTSFNDAVRPEAVRKLEMSSARQFGHEVVRAGKGAIIAKYDICDAFKLIPGTPDQWRYFGFEWLGRYFFDVTTVFGSKSAPANFDGLPETAVNIARVWTGMPEKWIFRQLDDVPFVSAAGSGHTSKFAEAYVEICRRLRIPLAEMCEKREKAFGPGTTGTVLGVQFDTESQTWSLSPEKVASVVGTIDEVLLSAVVDLKTVQRLHGKLNDFSQMFDFSKGFRFHLLELLASFQNDDSSKRLVRKELKRDLFIWKNFVHAAKTGLPLAGVPCGPPIRTLNFVSDAAGAEMVWIDGKSVNASVPGDRGVASVGFDGAAVVFCGGTKWPTELLTRRKDRNGKFLGGKSTLLESVGLLSPFVTIPNKLRGKFVRLFVDNTNVVYGWEKRMCKSDAESSAVIRALHILEGKLECKVFVEHMRRLSTPAAALADRLSRSSTTTAADEALVAAVGWRPVSGALGQWLEQPTADWQLAEKLMSDIDKIIC